MKTLKPTIKTLKPSIKSVTRTVRITGNSLQAIRREHFRMNPLCVACEDLGRVSLATELDHIVPLCEGGAESPANRQGLCCECHKAKTLSEATQRGGGGSKVQ